jgi:hypothetical protein
MGWRWIAEGTMATNTRDPARTSSLGPIWLTNG